MSTQKAALITGAAGGIGRAMANIFREAGFFVIATDRVGKPVDLRYDYYLQADLTLLVQDEAYAARFFTDVRDCLATHCLRLNVLINNAAIQILGGLDSLTRSDWRQTLDVNLLAPFLLVQALLPELEKAQGNVVNIGSIHARLTKKNFVAYATAKAALAGLTRAMAVDIGPRLRINAIEPAAIETEMLIDGFKEFTEGYVNLKAYHPIGRIGTAEEVARAALWLASDTSSFFHGACIRLDGGLSNALHDPC